MKLSLDLHPGHHTAHIHLGPRLRKALLAIISALAPYAIAALALFAYHEQYFR